jgi:hypothetical protein
MLAAVLGLAAWFLCQPSTMPQLEQSEKARSSEHASMRNNPQESSPTPKPTNDSVASRWQTSSPTASAAASDSSLNERWKPRP